MAEEVCSPYAVEVGTSLEGEGSVAQHDADAETPASMERREGEA